MDKKHYSYMTPTLNLSKKESSHEHVFIFKSDANFPGPNV